MMSMWPLLMGRAVIRYFGLGLKCELDGFLCEWHCEGVCDLSLGLCGYSLWLAVVDSSPLTCEIDPCQSAWRAVDRSGELRGSSQFQLCQPAWHTSPFHVYQTLTRPVQRSAKPLIPSAQNFWSQGVLCIGLGRESKWQKYSQKRIINKVYICFLS